jgi:hypothetical protein
VRGAAYAANFEMYQGINGDMPQDAIDQAIERTRVQPGWRDDRDGEAFRQGLNDIRQAGFGYEDVIGFWSSGSSKVSVEEAKLILRELGGRFPGTGSILFPSPAPPGE